MALLSSLFSLFSAFCERLSSLGVNVGRGFCELSRRKLLLVKAAHVVRILFVDSRRGREMFLLDSRAKALGFSGDVDQHGVDTQQYPHHSIELSGVGLQLKELEYSG